MEVSLRYMNQEEDVEERKRYTPRDYGDLMMRRLRGMKSWIEQKAKIPQWTLQEMEAIEALIRLGGQCNNFPTELEGRSINFAIMLERSNQGKVQVWTKEVRSWWQEWGEVYREWKVLKDEEIDRMLGISGQGR
jgi:hypothetical protein